MDAEYRERRRDHVTSRREKRWSMYSQRLEEIVAQLMKPISDIRRSFDTDLGALLEEYLTEAGIRALDASEPDHDDTTEALPNFTEVALLLQHSASVYGRKVDFLYQHVLSVSEDLHNNTIQNSLSGEESMESNVVVGNVRRKRVHSAITRGEFTHVELESWSGAMRDADGARPPPTLPRMYIELEPRVLTEHDLQLYDYAGEPVGLPADFYVTWRLQNGLLVDELAGDQTNLEPTLRPISLVELQAAIEAALPSSPSPPPSSSDTFIEEPSTPHPDRVTTPIKEETPLSLSPSPPLPPPPDITPILKKSRKRQSDVHVDDMFTGCFTSLIDEKLRCKLRKMKEFRINSKWIERVITYRKSVILKQRRILHSHLLLPPPPQPTTTSSPMPTEFRGFDSSEADIGGFTGWSESENERTSAISRTTMEAIDTTIDRTPDETSTTTNNNNTTTRVDPDSEDDGFFERSSLGDSDISHLNHAMSINTTSPVVQCDRMSWQERIAARAIAAEAKGGVDVTTLAHTVLDATRSTDDNTSFTQVLRVAAHQHTDVSRLFLATLFLANSGNVEIVEGAPLSVDTFSVRVLSRDLTQCLTISNEHYTR